MEKKKTERGTSSPADADRAWWRDRKPEPGIDGSIPPSALLALPAGQSLSDDVIRASILRWWRESPDDTQNLLEACFRSGQLDAPMGAARTLLKLPSPAAQRLGESILDRLADDGHNPARMELAGRRIRQWQQAEPAADGEVPSDIPLSWRRRRRAEQTLAASWGKPQDAGETPPRPSVTSAAPLTAATMRFSANWPRYCTRRHLTTPSSWRSAASNPTGRPPRPGRRPLHNPRA